MSEYRYLVRNSITGTIFLKCKTLEEAQENIDWLYETYKRMGFLNLEKGRTYDIIDLENISTKLD